MKDELAGVETRLAAAQAEFKEVQEKWIAAEKAQVEKLNKLPFLLNVQGPTTALPARRTSYTVNITDAKAAWCPTR